MPAAYGVVPVAPVWGRSEEESGAQDNSVLIPVSNPFSLSLVPVERMGENQSTFGGGPGLSPPVLRFSHREPLHPSPQDTSLEGRE